MESMKTAEKMKYFKLLFFLGLVFFTGLFVHAAVQVNGRVLNSFGRPVEQAVITLGNASAVTDAEGRFQLSDESGMRQLYVWADGYYPDHRLIEGIGEITIVLVPSDKPFYNQEMVLPLRDNDRRQVYYTEARNIAQKDFVYFTDRIDENMAGRVPGLNIRRNSGMPGEGSYINLRGIRSLTADNMPLIVVNGIPYMTDKHASLLVEGYNRDIFQTYHIGNIQNITVLKGADASLYGSLGSNGVILIETDAATSNDIETQVTYFGNMSVSGSTARYPMLTGDDYKSYMLDLGLASYSNMATFFGYFPFLKDPDNPSYAAIYNNQTDWQQVIRRNAVSTDHLIRVEGGDNIAKYDLSLGYSNDQGVLLGTGLQKYHTQLNSNILASKQVNIYSTVGLSYINASLQEQGMNRATNPILSALLQSPVLSPYNKDRDGNVLSTYAPYYFGTNTNSSFYVSNPLAVVNTLEVASQQFDINIKAGLIYNSLKQWSLSAAVGLYYNYDDEHLFIPGSSEKTIIPVTDAYGTAYNMARGGVAETMNLYWGLNGRWQKTLDDIHQLNALWGLQGLTTRNEYDAGEGRNSANDFYRTLNYTDGVGRHFFGYLFTWNWLNTALHIDYTWKDLIQVSANAALDGASSTGNQAPRMYLYPSTSLVWMAKNVKALQSADWINRLNLRLEYGASGNSRFDSNLSRYTYSAGAYDRISTIVRNGIPNTHLRPERVHSFNASLEISLLYDRLNLQVTRYDNEVSNLIAVMPTASMFGSYPYYDNIGRMSNSGCEFSTELTPLRLRHFEWSMGGSLTSVHNVIRSLGGADRILYDEFGDDLQIVTVEGKAPYQFYGYHMLGVFGSQQEADEANLVNAQGKRFMAGDVHFEDQNGDGRIDAADRTELGSAQPAWTGSVYQRVAYKNFSLTALFVFNQGNKAYNATRRMIESMDRFTNQTTAVNQRWTIEGQQTNMPAVSLNDPQHNGAFSDRWIEDASYVRLRQMQLSYVLRKPLGNFIQSGNVYLAVENLFTLTRYLGLDPEFSFANDEIYQGLDYAKLELPRRFTLGFKFKF